MNLTHWSWYHKLATVSRQALTWSTDMIKLHLSRHTWIIWNDRRIPVGRQVSKTFLDMSFILSDQAGIFLVIQEQSPCILNFWSPNSYCQMFFSRYRSWQIQRTWYMDSASILSMLNTYTMSFYKANDFHSTWLSLIDTNGESFCPDYSRKLKYSFTHYSNWGRLEMFKLKLTVHRCQTNTIFKHIYILG